MKLFVLATFWFLTINLLFAQQFQIENLQREARITQNDTLRLVRFRTIARFYAEINPDTSYYYAEQSLKLSRKLNLRVDEGSSLREMGYALVNAGNYPRSLQILLSALDILEDPKCEQNVLVGKFPGDDAVIYRSASPHAQRISELAFTQQILGILYANSHAYEKSLHHQLLARQKADQSGNLPLRGMINNTLNRAYLELGKTDSAMVAIQMAYEQTIQSGYKRYLGSVLLNMGRTYAALGNTSKANEHYRKAAAACIEHGYFRGLIASNLLLADYYFESGKSDSAFFLC